MSPHSIDLGVRAGGAWALAPALPPVRWRLLVTPPASGVENMAMDHALMDRARANPEVVWRLYGWREPTLSFGRHQSARGRYDLDEATRRGVRFVRRPTGGRAVVHHREVTYSVAAPEGMLGGSRESYRRINRLLVDALRRLGVRAEEARATGPAPRPGVTPCFEEPVAGEIVAGGRKLVGSAQWRDRGALLQHGSILVDDDQPLASALLVVPAPPPRAPATLRGSLGRAVDLETFAIAIGAAIETVDGVAPLTLETDPALERAARTLEAHYESDAWTWRR